MPAKLILPYRQIHLDFHTGPDITDVGVAFDAKAFAGVMKSAAVNSVTVFAKCHHGHLYYNTRRPERHPGLKPGLNLLGEQVEALHREGIRAPIYISVQCDQYAAAHHPEWVARQADGKPVGAGPFAAGWTILDMNSPYQDYLAEQTREVLQLFHPVDGLFFDMCWDQPSASVHAIEAMRRANLNPENEADRQAWARRVTLAYMKRFHQMVQAANSAATVHFNSRPVTNLRQEIRYATQFEIEALPTGGWGYMFFPRVVRFAHRLGKPCLGMTARFHKSWADFGGLKPYAALEYETSQMLAHSAACSIGDQLHPRGTLEAPVYELIGRVYRRVAAREPWLRGAGNLSDIGVLGINVPATDGGPSSGSAGESETLQRSEEGAARMLMQLKQQFDLLDAQAPLEPYKLVILPDHLRLSDALINRLRRYLKNGGAVVASGTSGLNDDATALRLPELAIQPAGRWPAPALYLRFGPAIRRDVAALDHVIYDPAVRVTPAPGAEALGHFVEPYFDRSWRHFSSHFQTPPAKVTRQPFATLRGRCAYIAFPVFGAYARHGNVPYRLLVRNILDRLLPEPLVRTEAPTGCEITVTRQRQRHIVHLLYYSPERRAVNLDLIEDIVPLFNVPLALRLNRRPRRVYVAPENTALEFTWAAPYVRVTVPEIRGHAMVVFE